MSDAPLKDLLFIAFVFVAMPFALITIGSLLLRPFVALNSPPTARAAWIVGIPSIAALASNFSSFGGRPDAHWSEVLLAVLAVIPGALIAFWWWRNDFRMDWIDDAEGVPDGVELANADWRIGLMGVLALFAAAAIKMMFLRAGLGQ